LTVVASEFALESSGEFACQSYALWVIIVPPQSFTTPELDLDHIVDALGLKTACPKAPTPYTIVPGNDGPRWLLPNRNKLTWTILNEWHPYSTLAWLSWAGIRLLARFGALPFLPGTLQTHLPANSGSLLLSHIGHESDALPPVILVGSPTATRKLIVFLVNSDHALDSVVKFPLTSAARVSIQDEAEILRRLDGKHRAPRLLHYSSETGAAMQQYLPGRMGSRRCKPNYLRLLLDLARTEDVVSLRARGLLLEERLRCHPAYNEHASSVNSVLAYLEEDAVVPAVLVHGDFAPWNIRELPDGACALVDWELAEWKGMPLHDLCHFFYVQTRSFSPDKLFYSTLLQEGSWRKYCGALDLPLSLVPRLAAAFLLAMLARNWETNRIPGAAFCVRQLEAFLRQIKSQASYPPHLLIRPD
jgi:hypothetical protein